LLYKNVHYVPTFNKIKETKCINKLSVKYLYRYNIIWTVITDINKELLLTEKSKKTDNGCFHILKWELKVN